MPFVAVTLVKLGVTVSPPETALPSVTVNVIGSPSSAEASAIVTSGGAGSSLTIVPIAWSSVTMSAGLTPLLNKPVLGIEETPRLRLNVSSASKSESSMVATETVCASFAFPMKVTLFVSPKDFL